MFGAAGAGGDEGVVRDIGADGVGTVAVILVRFDRNDKYIKLVTFGSSLNVRARLAYFQFHED